jgi:uncharacterized protein YaaQ
MKLIMAIVQDLDADPAMGALTKADYKVTRIASTGGFFRMGNTTLYIGTEDDQVEPVIDILRQICQERTRVMPINFDPSEAILSAGAYTEVPVGGATVLVFNVERFERF